ncbi:hypothetical protein LZC95_07945 [Pendulispora brunnea]|uniref:Uncharacterized protein n=1 Tax=Pendulispora brunnea TaxID=2905690 RepID=A0ABZ2KDI6_9BACT
MPWPDFSPIPRERNEAMEFAFDLQGRISELSDKVAALGLGSGGNFGLSGGNAGMEAMSSALFLAWRTLGAVGTWLKYGDEWPRDREELVRAAHILRGGTRAGGKDSNGHDLKMAIAMGRQALGKAIGVGCPKEPAAEVITFLRGAYSDLFGTIFSSRPPDQVIRAALEKASTRLARTFPSRDAYYAAFDKAGEHVARDVIFAAWRAAKLRPRDTRVFRFPMGDEETPESLLKRFQNRRARPSPSL